LLALGLPTTVGTLAAIKKILLKIIEGKDQMEKGKFPTKIFDLFGDSLDPERKNRNVLQRMKELLITRTNVGVGAAFLGFLLSKKRNKNYLFKSEAKNGGMISTIGKGISSATEIVLGSPVQPMPIRVFQFFLRNWIITVPFLFLILGTSYLMTTHKSSDAFSVKDILEMALKNAKEVNANLQNYFNRDHTEQLNINKKLSEKIDKQEKNTQEALKTATQKVDEVLARNGHLGLLNRDLNNEINNKNIEIKQIQQNTQKINEQLTTCLTHTDSVELAYIGCTKAIQSKETALPYHSQPLLGENSGNSELKNEKNDPRRSL
jgi:Skp family chaperone for outer membrane proteins